MQGCLGALDGTYIDVLVSNQDKPRYRTRKGNTATNVLAVCDRKMDFVYFLPGWEGSAGDSRVLRDAVSRDNGFKVPQGTTTLQLFTRLQICQRPLDVLPTCLRLTCHRCFFFIGGYYLCDNGYANSNGFLTPYKGVRYHMKEWGPGMQAPQNPKELFNMRHTKARNVIERSFAVLKMRWGILRSASYYPIQTQIRLIMACFLLHNFIRREMEIDPVEAALDGYIDNLTPEPENIGVEYVDCVEPTAEWTHFRDNLALQMWNNR